MSIEAYKVAVNVSLVENVTRGLMMMSRHFRTTDMEAKTLQRTLASIGKLTLVGGALAGAGAFGLGMLKGPIDEAVKYQTELARFASLGFGTKVNAQADQYARGMQTIGTSTRENMALVGDAMAVFKNLDHAKMAAPLMARMKFANQVLFGEGGGDRDRKLMDMLKVIEFRGGLSSDAEFARQADYAQKAIAGSRGRVDPTALLTALKTGGVALSRRSNDAFYLGGEPLIQEFGGFRYGTAAMSIYQNLVQSRGSAVAQGELYRLGLLNPSMVEFNSLGKLKRARPGAFVGSSILENDGEMALLQKVLLPAFARKGITGDENVIREIGMILGNRTGSALLSRIYQQSQSGSLGRQVAANRFALGVRQSEALAASSPAGKLAALHAKELALKQQIGEAVLPMYVKALEMTRNALVKINNFANAHPQIFGGMVKLFAAVSAAALVGGGIMLITAGFRALALIGPGLTMLAPLMPILGSGLMWLVRGIPVLFGLLGGPLTIAIVAVTAAAVLLYKNWDTVKAKTNEFVNWFGGAWQRFLGWLGQIKNYLPDVSSWHPINAIEGALGLGPKVPTSRAGAAGGGGHVFLDGRKVGQVLSGHLAKSASQPSTGSHFFDASRAPARP